MSKMVFIHVLISKTKCQRQIFLVQKVSNLAANKMNLIIFILEMAFYYILPAYDKGVWIFHIPIMRKDKEIVKLVRYFLTFAASLERFLKLWH